MARSNWYLSRTEFAARAFVFPVFKLLWRPKLSDNSKRLPLTEPCFVYGNHSHNYDPFILNLFTQWGHGTTGVLTQEYFRGKLSGALMRDIRLIPTRKHIPEPHLIRKLFKKIENNERIVIYPEGGRRWDGRPLPWIESTAKIFIKSGIPIFPISTLGSYIAWPRWAKYPRPARMRITCHEPFVFDRKAPFEEALAKLKAPIDFDESIVPDELKPKWAYRPADGIHRLLYRDPETGNNGELYTTDGTYVQNKAGTLRYKMLPDSTLLDEKTSEIFTTPELYEKVKQLPLQTNQNGALIENQVTLHLEEQFPELKAFGTVKATLYPDAVHLKGDLADFQISLQDLLHAGIERSSKLQLFQKDRMLQLSFPFEGGSALHWQDVFYRLKKQDNQPSTPVNT